MDSLSHSASSDNPHYVYSLAYSESMGGYVFYVGKGQGRRVHNHEQEAIRKQDCSSYKLNVIRKIHANGEKVTKKIIARFETNEEALQYEIALIFFLRPYGHLTNITDGGEGTTGWVPSEETKRKIKEANTGFKPTEETLRKLSESHKGQVAWSKGKSVPEKTRRKISKTLTGRKNPSTQTEESRRHNSESRKGKPHPMKPKPNPYGPDRKHCPKCDTVKPIDDFYIRDTKTMTRRSHCKECISISQRRTVLTSKGYVQCNQLSLF